MKRIAVTLTTIHVPKVLNELLAQREKYPHPELEVDYIIVGDRKTPKEASEYLKKLDAETEAKVIYLDIPEQEKRFSHLTALWNHIPENSFARRNYGDLLAYQENYDGVIRIDDDNFPTDDDFFGAHAICGEEVEVDIVKGDRGFYNVCETLEERENIPFYPRGYPYNERWVETSASSTKGKVKVGINAGLWVGDPDIDAVTRICKPIDATTFKTDVFGKTFALAKGTWCPINTQNTAFTRETLPAAFVSPFAGRYDDIFSGYFLRTVMDHLGHSVTYGVPLLNQIRNEHNLWKDLEHEMKGNLSCPRIMEILREAEFSGSNYVNCFQELIEHLKRKVDVEREYFDRLLEGMSIWAKVFE